MNADDMLIFSAAVNSLVHLISCENDNTRKRRWGIHPDNRRRENDGEFIIHFQKKKLHSENFFEYLRMTPRNFDFLLSILTPFMPKQPRTGRKRISNEQRLAVTLRYLATGHNIAHLSQTWLIGESTLRKIINETLPYGLLFYQDTCQNQMQRCGASTVEE